MIAFCLLVVITVAQLPVTQPGWPGRPRSATSLTDSPETCIVLRMRVRGPEAVECFHAFRRLRKESAGQFFEHLALESHLTVVINKGFPLEFAHFLEERRRLEHGLGGGALAQFGDSEDVEIEL